MRTSKCRFEIRKSRIRSKISRVSDRLRLSVFKSGRHVYAQLINDVESVTLVSASTLDKNLRKSHKSNCNIESALLVGELLGKRAAERGIKSVVFDKGGYRYHGVIKAVADGARKELEF